MTALNFSLLKWQQTVFKDSTRFKIVAAGRRCGKSRLSAVTLLIEALNCPEGSSVMYVAPTIGQARTIIWDLLHDLGRQVIKSSHVNNLEITLVNGRKILVRGADNPDSLRGVSLVYVVMDECAYIKQEVWEKIIRASLSDKKGRALFISTPSGRNWFYDLYKLGKEEEDEEWKSWHFTTEDNETIDPKEIEAAKRTLSSFAFKQEYLSSFDTAGSDVFKEEWFKTSPEPKDGVFVMAFDLAGFEAASTTKKKHLDDSAIAIVKITDDGKWWVQKIEYGRWDVKDTAMRLLRNIKEYSPVAVGCERGMARNAVLPYLTDFMRKYNTYAHIAELTHGNKKKTDRIVWSLQGRMEHGRVSFNEDEEWDKFKDQLIMFPTNGVHDDLVDALSYIDQLAVTSYNSDYEEDEYETYDVVSGY
jgi:Terminase large subunit, T4likevirus-type, N-terminal/Terminase RNaseH-like domain